jgi:hypothetical protein
VLRHRGCPDLGQKSAFQLDQWRASSSRILRSWSVTRDTNAARPAFLREALGMDQALRCASEVFDERIPVGLPFSIWRPGDLARSSIPAGDWTKVARNVRLRVGIIRR